MGWHLAGPASQAEAYPLQGPIGIGDELDLQMRAIASDRTVVSDERGRFLFQGVEAGGTELHTAMLGYETRHDSLFLPERRSVQVVIPMARRPIDMAPIRVEVRAIALVRNGFYERRESGYAGHFFTRADLVDRDARRLTELLGPLPGVRIMRAGIEGDRVVFERATTIALGV